MKNVSDFIILLPFILKTYTKRFLSY